MHSAGVVLFLIWWQPMFGRMSPEVKMKVKQPTGITRDDEIHIVSPFLSYSYKCLASNYHLRIEHAKWHSMGWYAPLWNYRTWSVLQQVTNFIMKIYTRNNIDAPLTHSTPASSLPTGIIPLPNPLAVDPESIKIGIQSKAHVQNSYNASWWRLCAPLDWAQHGICGRGVLLDLVRYYTASGSSLPYDPWTTHAITLAELEDCAKKQGVTFRQGDILIIRVGFIQKYYAAAQEARDSLSGKPETLLVLLCSLDIYFEYWPHYFSPSAGIEQSLEMKRFLWFVFIFYTKIVRD